MSILWTKKCGLTRTINGGDVFLGYDSTSKIIGHGRVILLLKDERIKTLFKVLHIPELARNLIYVCKMSDASARIVSAKETYTMVQGVMVLLRGVRVGNLCKLSGSTNIDKGNNLVVLENENVRTPTPFVENTMLWHQRMGHIGEKGLRTMHSKGVLYCSLEFDFCNHCIFGRDSHLVLQEKKRILELIQNDVFGLVPIPSLGMYYVSLIDDFSRKSWFYFLKKNCKVFQQFRVEGSCGKPHIEDIKGLRANNGRELCGNEFEQFYKQCGTTHQTTTPYTPEHNGVVERMNKPLVEKERSMLSGASIEKNHGQR